MTLRYFLLAILCLHLQHSYAQEEKYVRHTRTDTIHIQENTLLISNDSLYFIEKDTTIYLQDTIKSELEEILKTNEHAREKAFFERIQQQDDSSKLKEKIIDLLIDSGEQKDAEEPEVQSRKNPELSGKIVGKIEVRSIRIFGPSVNDTVHDKSSGLARLANRMHMYTRERVLRNRLLLEKGDVLDQYDLQDNERIIRALPYIRDARLIAKPAQGDTVDLLLISQDVVAYTGSAEPEGWLEGDYGLNNINLLGYGHQLKNTLYINPDYERKVGYMGVYRIPNIQGTFIEAEARYENRQYRKSYALALDRSFLTPGIRMAGGVLLEYQDNNAYAPWINNYDLLYAFDHQENIPRERYSMLSQDYWLGRSFRPDLIRKLDPRARFVLTARYLNEKFYERPEVGPNLHTAYHHRQLMLLSMGISKRYYKTEKLVYGFGRTEDIPVGEVTQITFGPEKSEFYKRFYTGLRTARGRYVKPLGYLSGGIRLGGYWHNKKLEEGMVQIAARTFSYPIQWKRTTFRLFFNVDYTKVLRPMDQLDFRLNMISLNDRQGIRGLRSYRMYGNQRLTISLETVAFLPVQFYSFRLAGFAFADAGLIAREDENLTETPLYQGYGIGFRIRNDRLAFKTFQLRIACYPSSPPGESFFSISIAGIPIPSLMDFDVRKPSEVRRDR